MSDDTPAPVTEADIQLIQAILPHRYPFLLVDRVRDIDGTSSATGIKNVTMNEPHFQGHHRGNGTDRRRHGRHDDGVGEW